MAVITGATVRFVRRGAVHRGSYEWYRTFPWPDPAAVLAAEVRLGDVRRSVGTHPWAARVHRPGQRRPARLGRRRPELGDTRAGRVCPCQRETGQLLGSWDEEAGIAFGPGGNDQTANSRAMVLAQKQHGGLSLRVARITKLSNASHRVILYR